MSNLLEPPQLIAAQPPALSIVVPTYNERENVAEVVRRVNAAFGGEAWEIIFVDDDSPDGTADTVRALSQHDARVRVVQRIGRRGLSSACVEGMLASSADFLAVMDADLQHDERILPAMLALLRGDEADIVVGSRYVKGGGVGDWDQSRVAISHFATRLSKFVIKADLSDPMSGFFMLRRRLFDDSVRNLSALGFKILVDLFASAPYAVRFRELPYQFRLRQAGESKLDSVVAWDYGMLILDKAFGRWVPVRFIAFSIVGGFGLFVHMFALSLMFKGGDVRFATAQALATFVAMTFNFAVNNLLTYRDVRLRGLQWLRGWVSFCVACGIGAVSNVGVAAYLFESNVGWIPAAIAGVLVGAVWNYAVTTVFTWGKKGSNA